MRKKSLIVAGFILLIDQIVKYSIDKKILLGKLKTVIPNFFYVSKVYNDGAAWSMLAGSTIFLTIMTILALAFLLAYQSKFLANWRNMLAFGLVYGGLLGNLLDRIIHGYVIDYLKLNFGSYNFPIFNLADVAIVSGVILIIIAILKGEDRNGSSSSRKC